jgi:hypothetical protein
VPGAVKGDHRYRVTFGTDTVGTYRQAGSPLWHPMDMARATDALYVYDITHSENLVYTETQAGSPRNNIIRRKTMWEEEGSSGPLDYTVFAGDGIYTDVFDGIKLTFNLSPIDTSWLDIENSGWLIGNSNMTILASVVAPYFAWDYDIIFTDTVSTKHHILPGTMILYLLILYRPKGQKARRGEFEIIPIHTFQNLHL